LAKARKLIFHHTINPLQLGFLRFLVFEVDFLVNETQDHKICLNLFLFMGSHARRRQKKEGRRDLRPTESRAFLFQFFWKPFKRPNPEEVEEMIASSTKKLEAPSSRRRRGFLMRKF
jgi:hypothetical protein